MSKLALDNKWLEFFTKYQTIYVGLSGGLDSVVLLHLLSSQPILSCRLHAVHVNHGLSDNALSWQRHCEIICSSLSISFTSCCVKFDSSKNIEEHARNARYEAFKNLLSVNDCLVLAHHKDDQAETLLLNLFRGAGVDGLSAMDEVKSFAGSFIYRPLLGCSRAELEAYASFHQLDWIDDESNSDVCFSRNYIRHELMPIIQSRWPNVVRSIARTAMHCQQAKRNLLTLAYDNCPVLAEINHNLPISLLIHLSCDQQVNVLRTWLSQHQVKLPSSSIFNRIIDELISAKEGASPVVIWGGVTLRRYKNALYIDKSIDHKSFSGGIWHNFPNNFTLSDNDLLYPTKAFNGFYCASGSEVEVSFRHGGELMHLRGQTKSLKKLFQEWDVPPWLRDKIPLIYVNNILAVVVGFAIDDRFYGEGLDNIYEIHLVS